MKVCELLNNYIKLLVISISVLKPLTISFKTFSKFTEQMKLRLHLLTKTAILLSIVIKAFVSRSLQSSCHTPYNSLNITHLTERTPKIVGGFQPPYLFFSWLVDIRVKSRRSNVYKHHCGGSIVADRYIISAAHCFHNVHETDVLIIAGEYDLENADTQEMTFFVDDIFVHPEFRQNGFYSHDLALVKLKKPISRNFKPFHPICLPSSSDTEFLSDCLVTGWGATNEDDIDPVSQKLRAASVPLLEQQICRNNKVYGLNAQEILDGMLCAGDLNGGMDSCYGDSGGPLTCFKDGIPLLVGIVSWGDGCAQKNKPGVYTRVSYYREWIDNIIKD